MEQVYYRYVDTPIGRLMLAGTDRGLMRIEFEKAKTTFGPRPEWRETTTELSEAARQLTDYFNGDRREFDLSLDAAGTEFQHETWAALRRIPFGETATYAEIANSIGRPKAVRAVGSANARNPLPIVVPCHRVIGSDGSLTGFAAGTDVKRVLLGIEGVVA